MPTLIASFLAADSVHDVGTVLLAVLGLGFLIMVHELGHFLACRLTGTRVETFSIGFGPRLFGWERGPDGKRSFTVGERRLDAATGAMDVRFAAVPLGGYVKMAGEIGGDGGPTSGAEGDEGRVRQPDEFPAKPFLARVFIISAGVLMNFLTAFVLYWVAYGVGVSDTPPVIGAVEPGGPAWRAGLRPGDRVLSVDGRTVRSFTDVRSEIVYGSSDEDTKFVVRRGDRTETLAVRPEYDEAKGLRQANLGQIAAWEVKDGKSPPFTIGTTERVLVEGRPMVGGMGAYTAVKQAIDLGYAKVRIEFPDRPSEPPRTLDLAPAHRWSASGPFRLGVVPATWRTVASVRGGAAERAGLLAGDEILAADGKPIDDPDRLPFLPSLGVLTVRRPTGPGASEERRLEVGARDTAEVAAFLDEIALDRAAQGAAPLLMPVGRDFEDGTSPAAFAGVRPGDRLLAIGDDEVATWSDIVAAAAKLTAAPVKLRVQSGSEPPREVFVTPRPIRDPRGPSVFGEPVAPREEIPVDGAWDAARVALSRTAGEVENIFRLIGRFFGIGGRVSFQKNVGGPFTIGAISSATVSLGLTYYLAFLAFISVNLAVLNILPIPVLDGGHLLFLVIEKVRGGRPLKEATIARFQMVGFLLLLALMAFALTNDFKNLFGS